MPETKELKPALTPDEWAAGRYERDGKRLHLTQGGTPLWFGGGDDLMLAWDEDLSPVIALANAALPDDDPRKIVRADVETLQNAWALLNGETWDDSARAVAIVRDKLAALLPPE